MEKTKWDRNAWGGQKQTSSVNSFEGRPKEDYAKIERERQRKVTLGIYRAKWV